MAASSETKSTFDAPVCATQRVDEIWRCFSHRQCADQNTKRHAASFAKPRRHDLHARRIDTGETNTRQEAKSDRGAWIVNVKTEDAVNSSAEK